MKQKLKYFLLGVITSFAILFLLSDGRYLLSELIELLIAALFSSKQGKISLVILAIILTIVMMKNYLNGSLKSLEITLREKINKIKNETLKCFLAVSAVLFLFNSAIFFVHQYGFDSDAFKYFSSEEVIANSIEDEDIQDIFKHTKKSYDGDYSVIRTKHSGYYAEAEFLDTGNLRITSDTKDATHVMYAYLCNYEEYVDYLNKNGWAKDIYMSKEDKYLIIESAYNFAYRVKSKVNDVDIVYNLKPGYEYGDNYNHNWGIINGDAELDIDVYMTETKRYSFFQFLGIFDPFNLIKKDENVIIIPISDIENVTDVSNINVYVNNYDKHSFSTTLDPEDYSPNSFDGDIKDNFWAIFD